MSDPIPLFPDDNPACDRLYDDLLRVANEHRARRLLTVAEMIGTLEVVKLDIWAATQEVG